jgi:hypothetical protein
VLAVVRDGGENVGMVGREAECDNNDTGVGDDGSSLDAAAVPAALGEVRAGSMIRGGLATGSRACDGKTGQVL